MNFLSKIYQSIEKGFVQRAPESLIRVENAIRQGGKPPSQMITPEPVEMAAKTLKDWKEAIAAASDRDSPNKTGIVNLHQNLLLDNHLMSTIETRILYAQRSKYKLVNENETENPELTWLLERPWFNDLIFKVLFPQYQGTSLYEFFDLNADGELEQINEIPQTHFNAEKGLILKEAGGSEGWQYKTGAFANQYLQVGRNDDLGMLTQLAPIVLAKKLGLGTLLDYVDKFGVPPIFITTDREDDTRLKELYNAALNFKRNHFMVGRGMEKFEIGQTNGIGTAPHENLMKFANDEISKRILGGSGLIDEKSFVGSANIQFNLTKDRFEKDKQFFKYIFNSHIKPRLVKLSPVYAPLATHYFDWDSTESLSQMELIDAISKLGNIYEIDTDYVEKVTGIPITGIKQNNGGFGGVPSGKK